MKRLFILFFCVFSGATFGMMSAVVMAGKLGQSTALFVGAIIGGVVALLLSPLFVFATRDENIFAKLVICFVLSFPVAAVSGLTYSPQIGIGLTLFSILSTFYFLRTDD